MMAFSGVRSSWLMLAMKVVLARFAASASSRARVSTSSASSCCLIERSAGVEMRRCPAIESAKANIAATVYTTPTRSA